MTRYVREFMGIPADRTPPGDLDPNYHDGYRGMRMRAGPGQAAYGAHRFTRRADLGSAGGFEGIHRESVGDGGSSGRLSDGRHGSSEERDGAVVWPDDPGFLHDFDSRGIRYSADDRPDRS